MKNILKYLPLFLLLTSCEEDLEFEQFAIRNASHKSILFNYSSNQPDLYPYIVCKPGTVYNQCVYWLDTDAVFVTFFDNNRLYDKWITNDSTIYGLGYLDDGIRFDDEILAIYCVDSKWLLANRRSITYPYQGDTTITYFESINGNEIIGRDGYFGPNYELLKK